MERGRECAGGVAQERPREGVHRLDQVAELAEVDGGLGGVLGPVPVGLDVPLDDGGPELGGRHRGVLREVAKNGRVGPAGAGLELLGADEDLGVVPELVGHLEHGHEAGVHADQVHLPAEEAVGRGEDARELLVVEAVGRAVVVGDAAMRGRAFHQAFDRAVEQRPAATTRLGGHDAPALPLLLAS